MHLSEGDPIPTDLTNLWVATIERFQQITSGLPQHRCVRWLMEHIVEKKYSQGLLPGTSMYTLLISIPENNKVSYASTLRVSYEELDQLVTMRLEGASRFEWETTCQPSELVDTFEHFLMLHSDWRIAASSN